MRMSNGEAGLFMIIMILLVSSAFAVKHDFERERELKNVRGILKEVYADRRKLQEEVPDWHMRPDIYVVDMWMDREYRLINGNYIIPNRVRTYSVPPATVPEPLKRENRE